MRDQWVEWLQDKQRNFFYGVIFVVASFFIAFQIYGKFHKPKSGHFLSVNQAFEKWMLQEEPLAKLEEALRKQPELETKFGALVAHKFIAEGQGDMAKPFADRVLARVHKYTPSHAAFAENSLLISQGKLSDALIQSVSLKSSLQSDSVLYGFNLVRIASLYRALENSPEEVASLNELQTFLKDHQEMSTILNQCFSEGDVTLSDYITHRTTQN